MLCEKLLLRAVALAYVAFAAAVACACLHFSLMLPIACTQMQWSWIERLPATLFPLRAWRRRASPTLWLLLKWRPRCRLVRRNFVNGCTGQQLTPSKVVARGCTSAAALSEPDGDCVALMSCLARQIHPAACHCHHAKLRQSIQSRRALPSSCLLQARSTRPHSPWCLVRTPRRLRAVRARS